MTMIRAVLIDNGHGVETPGKRSPDGKFREFAWARRMARAIEKKLVERGFKVYIVCPEERDTPLVERVRRVNAFCKKYRCADCVLLSIHNNAAKSDGLWHCAGGWSAYTSKGRTKADRLAECLYDSAEKHLATYRQYLEAGKKLKEYDQKQTYLRTDKSDGDRDLEANFYILKNTICPAVLTENLFQDNRADVDFLNSTEGFNSIVELHVDGVTKYFGTL